MALEGIAATSKAATMFASPLPLTPKPLSMGNAAVTSASGEAFSFEQAFCEAPAPIKPTPPPISPPEPQGGVERTELPCETRLENLESEAKEAPLALGVEAPAFEKETAQNGQNDETEPPVGAAPMANLQQQSLQDLQPSSDAKPIEGLRRSDGLTKEAPSSPNTLRLTGMQATEKPPLIWESDAPKPEVKPHITSEVASAPKPQSLPPTSAELRLRLLEPPTEDRMIPTDAAPLNATEDVAAEADITQGLLEPHGQRATAEARSSGWRPTFAPPPVTQLSQAVLAAETGRSEILLSPEELGHVKIEIRGDLERLQVFVQADRPETQDLMRRSGDRLAAELRAAGYQDVDLNFGGQPSGQNATRPEELRPDDPQGSLEPFPAAIPDQLSPVAQGGLYLRI